MIQMDLGIFIILIVTVVALSYGAGSIGFKNLWGYDDDKSNDNTIKFDSNRYVRHSRKAQ